VYHDIERTEKKDVNLMIATMHENNVLNTILIKVVKIIKLVNSVRFYEFIKFII